MDKASSESSDWRSSGNMDATNCVMPSIRKNVLVNSISMKLRRNPTDVRIKYRDTEKDKVRLDILERQLFKAGIRPDRSLFKWDNPTKCQQKNQFRTTNLNKRNFQRMRGHRNGIVGDISNSNFSDLSSTTSFSSSEDSGGCKKKRDKNYIKIELEDWEVCDDVETAINKAGSSRLTGPRPLKSSSTTKQSTDTKNAANGKAESTTKNDKESSEDGDENGNPDEPYTGPKKAKAPKVPFDNYSIRPLYNRAKTSILPGIETTDANAGYKWAFFTQSTEQHSCTRKSWPNRSYGSVMKNVHPVTSGLDKEGTSIERLRFKVLNKPGDLNVTKVWPRQDIGTIVQPNLWAREASKLMMFQTF